MAIQLNGSVIFWRWLYQCAETGASILLLSLLNMSFENLRPTLCIRRKHVRLSFKCVCVKDKQRQRNWQAFGFDHKQSLPTQTNMTFQCHLELLGLALMARSLRNGSIDRSHTRWNLSICHNLVSCLRLAYKEALIEWSQFTKTKWSCVLSRLTPTYSRGRGKDSNTAHASLLTMLQGC